MKAKIQFYVCIVGGIVLFDAAASLASRSWGFDYTKLVWVSRFLYLLCGYFGFRFGGLLGGTIAGLLSGIADSTIGWPASSAIGPRLPFVSPQLTPGVVVIVIIFVSVQAALFGFVGALARLLLSRRKNADQPFSIP